MTLTEAMSELKAAIRNDDGSVIDANEIKRCAAEIVMLADTEAQMRALRQMPLEQQQDAVFCAVLKQIAQPC